MSEKSMRIGAAAKNLRNIFILFLLFTFIITVGSVVLKYSIGRKLEGLSARLKEPSPAPEISNILLELNSAENDFQQANLNGNAGKLVAYKDKLSNVFAEINRLLVKYQADSARFFPGSRQLIAGSFAKKLEISQRVFDLKQHFDSLLKATTPAIIGVARAGRLRSLKPDTTVSIREEATKSGLLKRLKNAIANKNQVKVLTIRERQRRDSARRRLTPAQLLQQLNKQNAYLLLSNEQLITANLNLLAQLHQLLEQLKDVNQAAWERSRNDVLEQYQSTTSDMDHFISVAITLILVFIILLIYFIRKAGAAEQNYLMENERAVALAGQKSEILATMSHEIRNPLTAITGAIYMLNKTNLSADQEQKVSAINLSSAMLMETVNNILDLSALEHQQGSVLLNVAFTPYQVLREAVESMRFMAEKKGILLTAEFAGDESMTVIGDTFKLKQIMVNLLSNAIKYTDEGGVTVSAILHIRPEQNAALEVSIRDTGIGIPKEQQAGLFTRYYQGGGSDAKPGTGLGLYLCKQLVGLQGGTISVESDTGKGCLIRFTIPYPPQVVDTIQA
ncbi:HAMP domain-containing sensor histidine kinase [Mucilaginibacter sp.]|uniref:sensor histidine kinase n=1 Tax=Mucilaginibacter sp. TaxID=1882438 RepID=UPI00284FEB35|nr:HAMP domain-containing sensor histidine kinase [Mucilaginibacter sp.]MDR3695647.1 HAMP domain-containing sensor histidine kinase [Mucilaginibacter sp.]